MHSVLGRSGLSAVIVFTLSFGVKPLRAQQAAAADSVNTNSSTSRNSVNWDFVRCEPQSQRRHPVRLLTSDNSGPGEPYPKRPLWLGPEESFSHPRDSLWNGALIGIGVGAVIGTVAIKYLSHGDAYTGRSVAFGALVGGLAGVLIDAAN